MNLAKTKIIVFRNGEKLSSKEKFLYNGKTIDIVTHYKYLGIVFNSRLTWGHAIKELAGKATKSVSMIRRAMWKLGVFEHKALFKIFDSLVVPSSEVWGYEYQSKIEQVHINFCKSVLGVGKYASNSAVRYLVNVADCHKVLYKIHQLLAKDPPNGSRLILTAVL